MDLQSLSLPDWLPWWAVVALLVPVALYLALFLLMPFSTFGLRSRLRDLELRIDALHEEIRALTLRLPERGPDFNDDPRPRPPPIPPAPREGPQRDLVLRDAAPRDASSRGSFGDPVADRMLAYMRDKAQTDLHRGDQQRTDHRLPRPRIEPRAESRSEPRFVAPRAPETAAREPAAREPASRDADLPPPPNIPGAMPESFAPEGTAPPRPPPVPTRFGRRASSPDPDSDPPRIDWPR